MAEEKTTTKTPKAKKAPAEKKVVCKGHNPMHICWNCNETHCKERGYFKMHRCKNQFFWLASLATIMLTLVASILTYLCVRLVDENWKDASLPLILFSVFIIVTAVLLTVCGLRDYKHRLGDAIYEE